MIHKGKEYDFCGYASVNDTLCVDGRIIRKDAFIGNDGVEVPMVWNHRHDDPNMIIGHALLENRPNGVFGYYKFNNTERGLNCKQVVNNRDLKGVSIYANNLEQRRKGNVREVLHGTIQEVSLVLQPGNPGALIDFSSLAHSSEPDADELYSCSFYDPSEDILHDVEENNMKNDELMHSDEGSGSGSEAAAADTSNENETVGDILDTLTEKQKNAFYTVIGALLDDDDDDEDEDNDDDDDEDEGEPSMKHNVFQDEYTNDDTFLSHSAQQEIIELAKKDGSFKHALKMYCDDNSLQHDAISSGFNQDTSVVGNITYMFPEYQKVHPGAPELITNDQGWVSIVLNKCHKSPVTRIRTNQVDIRNLDSLRARGYQKGKEKQLMGTFEEARRETDPQTVYNYYQLFRDDIIDIVDFDYVNYMYNIQRMMLNEELAMAIMLGDFRPDNVEGKIKPQHIRPIWTDDDLYTIHTDVDIESARSKIQGTETGSYFSDNYVYAEAMIESALYARERYKGTGTPDFFLHPHTLNVMLLSRDRNGRRIFSGKNELASALNVNDIYTVEQFDNRIRTDSSNHQHKLLGIMCNLTDYTIGHTKGGEITHFTDFDLKFNAQQSLLETRLSGTLTRLWSAIVLEEPVA